MNHTIPTTLIFHLYVFDGCFDSIIYKEHKWLLNKYSNIFDRAIISICLDNLNDFDLIKIAQREISSVLNVKEVEFKIVENCAFGEVQTFKNEVINNIENIDGSVFFAHGKGITNANKDSENIYQIMTWIHALYFYSLNYMLDVEDYFYKRYPPNDSLFMSFFGPCLRYHYGTDIQVWNNKTTYMGTFYWFNASKLKRIVADGDFVFPEVDSRYYCEMFPTLFGDCPGNLAAHNMVRLSYSFFNPYWGDWSQYISWFGDSENFNNEHNELLEAIGYKQIE